MTDDEIDGRFQAGTRDLAHAEADLRPPLFQIERRAQRRRRRSTIMRGTLLLACLAGLTSVIVATRGSKPERVTIAGPSTSTTDNTTPNKTTPTYPTPTVEPSRVMPWISTIVEPNTRYMFRHTLDASGVHNAPNCALDDLLATAELNGAGGTLYAGIDVRNRTRHPCYVQGSPYVGFLDGATSLAAYSPHLGASDPRVVLLPTSWARLGLTPVGTDNCGATNGNVLPQSPPITAIRFGLDSTSTRVVRVPRPGECPPSLFGYAGAFETVPVDQVYGTLYAPLHTGLALDAPATVERGRTVSYSIMLTDTDPNTFALVGDGCPLYRTSLGATKSTTLLLNCGSQGLLIAPATTVRFEMRFAIPADQPLGATTLTWQFVEPEEPALSARVTVVDGSTTTTP
jgi:hypothetical protein